MLETMIACAVFGSIIGSCATTILILLLIVARPDTLRKVLEELMEMKEYFRGRKTSEVPNDTVSG